MITLANFNRFGFSTQTTGVDTIATFGPGGDYADIGALIAAGLPNTLAQNKQTGAEYLTTADGYPIALEVSGMGTFTKRAEVVGTEANAGECLDTSVNTDGGSVVFSGTSVNIICSASNQRARLFLAQGSIPTGHAIYAAMLMAMPTGTNAALTSVRLNAVTGSESTVAFPRASSTEIGLGTVLPENISIKATATPVGTLFAWVEMYATNASQWLRVDGGAKVEGDVGTSLTSATLFIVGTVGDRSTDSFEAQVKNLRVYSIA